MAALAPTHLCGRRAHLVAILALLGPLAACGKGLSGTYSKCIALSASSSRLAAYDFPGADTFGYKAQTFPTANCSGTATVQTDSTGTYTTASSDVSGAQNIDFAFSAGSLNNSTLYQVYRLDSGQLYLGDTSSGNDASTSAKRPVALETVAYAHQ